MTTTRIPRTTIPTRTTARRLALIGAGVAVTIAACGSDGTSTPAAEPAAAPPPAEAAPAAATPEPGPAAVTTATTALGDVLVDAAGLTLYGFTPDAGANPTCEGACADAWPPILVDELPAGLDPAVFSTATRPDGTTQLVAGQWPLYLFAGDAAPGDTAGQGSGDQWFAVAPDGSLIGAEQGATAPAEQDGGDGY